MNNDLLKSAVQAQREAYGVPDYRCRSVREVVHQYPEAMLSDGLPKLLAMHDRGECDCTDTDRAEHAARHSA